MRCSPDNPLEIYIGLLINSEELHREYIEVLESFSKGFFDNYLSDAKEIKHPSLTPYSPGVSPNMLFNLLHRAQKLRACRLCKELRQSLDWYISKTCKE